MTPASVSDRAVGGVTQFSGIGGWGKSVCVCLCRCLCVLLTHTAVFTRQCFIILKDFAGPFESS